MNRRTALSFMATYSLVLAACGGESAPPPPEPAWAPVGVAGFSAGGVSNLAFDADAAGTLYVAFADTANGGRATVMSYAGAGWTPVGAPGFTPGPAGSASFCLVAGVPYVAFVDGAGSANVMRYEANAWVNVGAAFSDSVRQVALACDGAAPYVVLLRFPNGSFAQLTGLTLDGSTWTTLPGFEAYSSGSVAYDKSITAHVAAGKVLFGHYDYGGGMGDREATVGAYDLAARSAGVLSSFPAEGYIRPAIASFGAVVYWALVDGGNLSFQFPRPRIYRLTPGTAPAPVSSEAQTYPSAGYVTTVALAADASGPYVAQTDTTVSGKLAVRRWTGSLWAPVGLPGFSPSTVNFLQMKIVNGIPHVAFQDAATGKATVMKYE